MTRLEIMKLNQKTYVDFSRQIDAMDGIAKAVAQTLTLTWIKGKKWMGGISDSEYQKGADKLEAMGYAADDIMNEFDRQMVEISDRMFF